ncbi:phosphocarrier protein HPr [Aquibacillus halophilus]|uniref:Phosphocarrier protein HPr n=1 Tax=Aquibacillus halophilus TaxID=930132 RepID=A0A6A8DH05_9BACI|nr:phosphocarrier protein HPr [Aquibacillus halophilus]MRH44520.1 phosphocarrier protein HPr [Aquibacillus halophilus]
MVEKTFKVIDPLGIHARPATVLIQQANRFNSEIKLEYGKKVANLKSIMGVMSLAIEHGASFKLSVNGHDEEEALNNLVDFLHTQGLAE